MWIELPRLENLANTYVRHTETLDSCFDRIGSHQQCIPWSNQRLQISEPKLCNRANSSSYCTQMTPNQLVMVIARPINLNVSCKLHPYSLERTRSPPGPCLSKRIRNTHPRNYYGLKGKNIDVYFSSVFINRRIILWIELAWPENPANT